MNEENMNINPENHNETVAEEAEKKKNSWVKELRDWVIAIVIAVVVALLVRSYVFTLVRVQGSSMEPTLQNFDRLFVNRLSYTPEKGDIIIFIPEVETEDGKKEEAYPFVKRIIATEGDSVYIDFQAGEVYVNGELLDEPYIKEPTVLKGSYISQLENKGEYSPEKPIVVMEDHVFVLGDNRNNSVDSRQLGQIPVDDILGGAVFRFWPLSSFGDI